MKDPLHHPLVIKGRQINPPLMLAPMAGITHSAFRRLVAGFGGHGALITEMLSARALLHEDFAVSPFTRRRPEEGTVMYQLRLTGAEEIERVIERLATIDPFGIDINLGCPAPEIMKCGGGGDLFDDFARLESTLRSVRKAWPGLLTVKCRLGRPRDDWRPEFEKRITLFETEGIDAITVHPRFSDEKLKRRARHELFPWIVSLTSLPIIANGDIALPETARALLGEGGCSGVMVGRMAAVKPWIFSEFCGNAGPVDFCETWARAFDYILEDFRPEKAIGRVKEFSKYFAQNFVYGHLFYRAAQGAKDLTQIRERATAFLSSYPQVEKTPSVMGL